MKNLVIGTAGHVDHGKTQLIKALTGKETDRLKEEKERGISIELGFASFKLPSGILAGVVDVPGHERFIKNMLAGVGGMDLVLLVVAADEGVMPQTREHLEILDLIGVQKGIIVVTKIDMVDGEWIELVKEEIKELVKGTVFENSPLVEVSSVSGQGINELTMLIDSMAKELTEHPETGFPRLAIDRVFSITGFGTVVTGTLLEGKLKVGDVVEILPQHMEVRVRTLQVHGQKVEIAPPGQRVAVNLVGVEKEDIRRGNVLAVPGVLKTSHRLDVLLKLLPSAEKPLKNRSRVRVHIGTDEILARVILLETDEMKQGETGFAQLECEEPMVAARGDRLVIRSYSPMRTIAGGKVINSSPPKRKRFDPEVIQLLKTTEKGSPEELVVQYMKNAGEMVYNEEHIRRGTGLSKEDINKTIEQMVSSKMLKSLTIDNNPYYVLTSVYRQKASEMMKIVEKIHSLYPLRTGAPKEEIRAKAFGGMSNKLFNVLLEIYQEEGLIESIGEYIAKHGYKPEPDEKYAELFKKIERRFLECHFQTPSWGDIVKEFSINQTEAEEILNYFLNRHILIKLEENVLIHQNNIEEARKRLVDYLRKNGEISLGEARDLLKTSRKYALPIMNYFDKEKITRRVDDKRILY